MFVIYGEEQKLAKGVATVIAPARERRVPVGAFGEPELHGVVAETHWTIFDELMIA